MRNTLDEGRSKNYHLRPLDEMLAQLVEHVTFNHRVAGSIPARLTTISERQAGFPACLFFLREPIRVKKRPDNRRR